MKLLLQIFVVTQIFSHILSKDLYSLSYNVTCPPNMYYYYPNEHNHTVWICECKPTFLYYPEHDSCYDAYRQGPCPSEHYLVLPEGEKEAKCVENPCLIDGFVFFQGRCEFLWRPGPPCESYSTYLGVDEKTFEIRCDKKEYNHMGDNLITSKSCPEHTIFRPLYENDNTYTCECKPGRFYYSENSTCYAIYRQGPCPPEHYVVISSDGEVPLCEKNPCLEDGLVPFQESCHVLGKTGPPCENDRTGVDVNEETFELECIYIVVYGAVQGASGIIKAPLKTCPAGSRRISTGFCKRVFQ